MDHVTLDPFLAACADFACMQVCAAAVLHTGGNIFRAFALLAEQDAIVREATACGYLAPASQARAVRHASYSAGLTTPPARATAVDRAMAEARRWGLDRKAAA